MVRPVRRYGPKSEVVAGFLKESDQSVVCYDSTHTFSRPTESRQPSTTYYRLRKLPDLVATPGSCPECLLGILTGVLYTRGWDKRHSIVNSSPDLESGCAVFGETRGGFAPSSSIRVMSCVLIVCARFPMCITRFGCR